MKILTTKVGTKVDIIIMKVTALQLILNEVLEF